MRNISDTQHAVDADGGFPGDDLVAFLLGLATELTGAPFAAFAIVDGEGQHFLAARGWQPQTLPPELTLVPPSPVADARQHGELQTHPNVTGAPFLRALAAYRLPLAGQKPETYLLVADTRARTDIASPQLHALCTMAAGLDDSLHQDDGRAIDTRRIIDAIPTPLFYKDADCRYLGCNQAFATRVMGRPAHEIVGKTVYDLAPKRLAAVYDEADREVLASGGEQTYETQVRFADGTIHDIAFHKAVLPDGEGLVGVMLDITERKCAEEALRASERIFRDVFEASEDAILILDGHTFIDCNDATVRMLRCKSKSDLLPVPPWDLSPSHQPDGRLSSEKAEEMIRTAFERHFHRFEWIHTRADGEDFPCEVTLTTVELEGRQALYVVWNDITERKEREAEIERLANYDPLTGLPNRRLLHERGSHDIALAKRHGRPLGVMFMDLDRFKDINDTQGHDVGDALLVEITKPLADCLREVDTLARLGGDEFAVLLPDADSEDMQELAQRVLRVFDEPFRVHGISVRIGASIGVVKYPQDGEDLSELLKNADIAMYRAKAQGGGYVAFRAEQSIQVHERVQLERELERALNDERVGLHYQPRVAVPGGGICGVEALARWRHPSRGWISPRAFIPIAETTGIIHLLGRLVLEQACRQLARWRAAGIELQVAINLSARELQRDGIVEQIAAALERHAVPRDRLEIEVTETAAMSEAEASVRTLSRIKALGVHIAIDDFGTGYSSLSYLKRLPVDHLKIDYSFVRDMLVDPTDAGIIQTIVALADSLGIGTTAEGVENADQHRALRALGCTQMQGYLYCPPTDPQELEPLLRTGRIALPGAK